DNIVYKTMNMLNRNCKTSFAKPEFLKKARRANPRLYDIGCYNDNLALMLAHESEEVIRLEKESRSKLSDLIRPSDYEKLNNLYDLFVPQREKSSEQRYFSKREYYYADHINAILGVYTELDEVTNLQCDYLEMLDKCECLEKELSKSKMISKSFEALQKHAINLELDLQQFLDLDALVLDSDVYFEDCFLRSLLLAPGFLPWGTSLVCEEGFGALESTDTSKVQMAFMWSVKGGIMYSSRRDINLG
nr:hypothetical protein [Tanacetum cinerariifolium]